MSSEPLNDLREFPRWLLWLFPEIESLRENAYYAALQSRHAQLRRQHRRVRIVARVLAAIIAACAVSFALRHLHVQHASYILGCGIVLIISLEILFHSPVKRPGLSSAPDHFFSIRRDLQNQFLRDLWLTSIPSKDILEYTVLGTFSNWYRVAIVYFGIAAIILASYAHQSERSLLGFVFAVAMIPPCVLLFLLILGGMASANGKKLCAGFRSRFPGPWRPPPPATTQPGSLVKTGGKILFAAVLLFILVPLAVRISAAIYRANLKFDLVGFTREYMRVVPTSLWWGLFLLAILAAEYFVCRYLWRCHRRFSRTRLAEVEPYIPFLVEMRSLAAALEAGDDVQSIEIRRRTLHAWVTLWPTGKVRSADGNEPTDS
ncbi:hypothetical protein KQI84_08270 [bacterium]|nr:hypothetical protein [bacterium]